MGVGSPSRRLNSRATRVGSRAALRSAASPTSTSPSSRRNTTEGIVAERSPRVTTSTRSPRAIAAAEKVVPRSTPRKYATAPQSFRLRVPAEASAQHGGAGCDMMRDVQAATGGFPRMKVSITVNGEGTENDIEPRVLLVHYVREVVGLTGTNVGCDTSSCGACTLHLDGEAVKSCTVLAVQADGHEVTTIEGLASGDQLHPMQEAFRQNHGLQCGYCTPGMVMAAVSLLREIPNPSEAEVRMGLEGNLCRCTGYHN